METSAIEFENIYCYFAQFQQVLPVDEIIQLYRNSSVIQDCFFLF